MADLLIVDDDPIVAGLCARYLSSAGHSVRLVSTGAAALAARRARRPDVTLLGVRLPDMTGFDVFARMRVERPVVIMISGDDDIPLAVRAVQEGVETFLATPVEPAQLGAAVDRAVATVRQRQLARYLTERRVAGGRVVFGRSAAMHELAAQLHVLAGNDRAIVLLQGEHGTGKARVAAWLHAHSPRADGPFLSVHCAARSASTGSVSMGSASALEAELFGSDDPTAGLSRDGLLDVAAGGTLLLEAIDELPLALQLPLLRFLETGCFRRIRGTREIAADVRIVAASNGDLASAVNAGRFHEALYYRLSVMPVTLSPLRSRPRDDVMELIARLMDELAPQLSAPPRTVDEAALDVLVRYPWPGNMHELRSVLERAMILGRGAARLDARFLPPDVVGFTEAARARGWPRAEELRTLHAMERAHIEHTLRRHAGNRTHASRALGIARATLIKKIKAFGLSAGAG